MSYGSNEAVEDEEERCREERVNFIAYSAAELVAAGDMTRPEAIRKINDCVEKDIEADGDETGVVGIENVFPVPSKRCPRNQVAAIASELLAAAQEAVNGS